ncbi:ATP-binding protein [Pseudomonas aeruginosa]|nr:ATP-binding protein [Pseudomonas aeruginosa]
MNDEVQEQPLKLEIDLNVLNHLGINLYSNTPAVLTEIVANAWDADATSVDVVIDSGSNTITITDDGIGMDYSDLKTKFLTVGYPEEIMARPGHQVAVSAWGEKVSESWQCFLWQRT